MVDGVIAFVAAAIATYAIGVEANTNKQGTKEFKLHWRLKKLMERKVIVPS
nr:hypothetical protein [Lactiplantibacillus plantarum]